MDNQNNNNDVMQTGVPEPMDNQITFQNDVVTDQTGVPMPQNGEVVYQSDVMDVDTLSNPSNISLGQTNENPSYDTNNSQSTLGGETPNNQNVVQEPVQQYGMQGPSTTAPRTIKEAVNSDDLIKAYVGPNYDLMIKRLFNFGAFFFTVLYYFYRKMILNGLLIMFLQGVMVYFFPDKLYLVLIINVLCGLFTNRLYINFTARKINKIIKNNPGKSLPEIKGMCYALGGRSFKRVVIAIIWFILLLVPALLVLLLTGLAAGLMTYLQGINIKMPEIDLSSFMKEETVLVIDGEYNGSLEVDKSSKISDEFDITIPKNFTKELMSNDYEYSYNYRSNINHLGNCSLNYKAVKGFSSAEVLAKKMKEYYKEYKPSQIKKEKSNSILWYTFKFTTQEANIYYRLCDKGSLVYVYYYEDQIDSSNICHSDESTIFHSIALK